jgi:hypothetical protein
LPPAIRAASDPVSSVSMIGACTMRVSEGRVREGRPRDS